MSGWERDEELLRWESICLFMERVEKLLERIAKSSEREPLALDALATKVEMKEKP